MVRQANPMPSSSARNGGPVLLEFKCPHACKPMHVEVPGDTEAVKSNWTREIRVRCPHCRAVHWFSYRSGYIEAAISQLNQAPAARDASPA
jgi:phage FluMu protein Com